MTSATRAEASSDESAALLVSGRAVLEAESRALAALAETLGAPFAQAVGLLVACRGRVVVTGMGKSGHIARKIAATLASTGTPALFVHPGEASHGDLGMVLAEDCVVALSNSGETAELASLVEHTRRFKIPLVALTGRESSALAQAADVVVLLPALPEAGALGLAPTTSTTMMLALGDALAAAALERRGFTAEDFRVFHPGGNLGNRLVRVDEVMRGGADLPLVAPTDKMAHVLVVMTEKRFGCAGVVDAAGRLVGIVTDGDLRRHMRDDLLGLPAAEVMTPDPMTVPPRLLAAEVLKLLNDTNRTQIFVVDDSKPVGIVHLHDLLRTGARFSAV